MIITGDDFTDIHSLQHFLSQHFEMKDLGTLSYFLGLEVTLSSDGYYLSQAKYASDLLSKAGITENKTVSTPFKYNAKLTPLDCEPISDATHYRQLVDSLIYLTITRSNISHVLFLFFLYTHVYYTCMQSIIYVSHKDTLMSFCLNCFKNIGCLSLLAINSLLAKFFKSLC